MPRLAQAAVTPGRGHALSTSLLPGLAAIPGPRHILDINSAAAAAGNIKHRGTCAPSHAPTLRTLALINHNLNSLQVLADVSALESCQRCRFVRHVLSSLRHGSSMPRPTHAGGDDIPNPTSNVDPDELHALADAGEELLLPFLAAGSTKYRLANLLQVSGVVAAVGVLAASKIARAPWAVAMK